MRQTVTPHLLYEDADAHCAHARDRRYAAEDPEGHVWYFATPLE
jgi:hypothetical protein